MAIQRALADLEMISRFERLDSPALADAQRGHRVMDPRIHSYVPGSVIAGRAFTVLAPAGSMMSVQRALLEAQPGDIIVVDARGDLLSGGLWGDLMSLEAIRRDFKGVIIDGAVRDANGLREVEFPTFAVGVTPRLGSNLQIGEINVPVSCGGVAITPGDLVFADDDGIVVVPAGALESVLDEAERIRAKDREIAGRLEKGEYMADMLGFRRHIYHSEETVSVLSHPSAAERA